MCKVGLAPRDLNHFLKSLRVTDFPSALRPALLVAHQLAQAAVYDLVVVLFSEGEATTSSVEPCRCLFDLGRPVLVLEREEAREEVTEPASEPRPLVPLRE